MITPRNVFKTFIIATRCKRSGTKSSTSSYRSRRHSIEADKTTGSGSHVRGRAVDVACAGVVAFEILIEALAVDFTGIGKVRVAKKN